MSVVIGAAAPTFTRNATYFQQRSTLDDSAGAAKERSVPQIVAVLHDAIKKLALVGHRMEGIEVFFKWIRGEKNVGCLQHRQLVVFEEPSHADL